METCSFPRIVLSSPLPSLTSKNKHSLHSQIHKSKQHHKKITPLFATLNSPKGFGPSPKKLTKKPKQQKQEDEQEDDGDQEGGVIPEIVTNRMITRMGYSVGIPLFIGLLFFPFFYYLKVGLKIDVPTWVPFIVSFVFFGTALLGVSYGIVSSSWDPMREGSTLGWNEAKKNWPVFWQSIWGGGGSTKK
ncbi:Protein PAM68, chloroplastic [Capsicum annuum]|uniref:Protein PAM68, chloroplastic n=1 Tax=Capsicum annuum TaxID=4072 RepID=A0A2G2YAA0_CAPAN|nr:protein PAM68, chloroplastic [Capsicum annuum]PHT66696.1 Protein PAM68, chloroplastic [Capsicum annuum]